MAARNAAVRDDVKMEKKVTCLSAHPAMRSSTRPCIGCPGRGFGDRRRGVVYTLEALSMVNPLLDMGRYMTAVDVADPSSF